MLPAEVLRLPAELALVDASLHDPAFFAPFASYFDPVLAVAQGLRPGPGQVAVQGGELEPGQQDATGRGHVQPCLVTWQPCGGSG